MGGSLLSIVVEAELHEFTTILGRTFRLVWPDNGPGLPGQSTIEGTKNLNHAGTVGDQYTPQAVIYLHEVKHHLPEELRPAAEHFIKAASDHLSKKIKEGGNELDGGEGIRLVDSAGNVYVVS